MFNKVLAQSIIFIFQFFCVFLAQAQMDGAAVKSLPMKRILADSAQQKSLAPPHFKDQKFLRQNRSYKFSEGGLKVIEASEFIQASSPLEAPLRRKSVTPPMAPFDSQREVDANDGDDITAFEEVGAALTIEHLAHFDLCKKARLENGICNKNSYWMAVLSAVAYLKYPLAFEQLKKMGFDDVTFIEGASDVEVVIAKKRPQRSPLGVALWDTALTVVAFRGTDDPVDWLTNLKTTTLDISSHSNEAWLHQGFAEALDEVYPNILNALKLATDKSPIFVTGHSLGGALATQLAIRLVSKEDENAAPLINKHDDRLRGLYTYAIPRVGNAWARNILDHYMNATRNFQVAFQQNADPVTKVPFHWWGFRRSALQTILPQKATSSGFGDRSSWQCYADVEFTGPSVMSWDFWGQEVEAHYLRSYLKYVLPFQSEAFAQGCPDDQRWGPRFAHEAGHQPLKTAEAFGKTSCDYSTYTWGGNIQ